MSNTLHLTQGAYARVDDDVFEWASKHSWCLQKPPRSRFGYACRTVKKDGKNLTLYLQRAVVDAGPDQAVHFRNKRSLDCRRKNLKLVPRDQWQRHKRPKRKPELPKVELDLRAVGGGFPFQGDDYRTPGPAHAPLRRNRDEGKVEATRGEPRAPTRARSKAKGGADDVGGEHRVKTTSAKADAGW